MQMQIHIRLKPWRSPPVSDLNSRSDRSMRLVLTDADSEPGNKCDINRLVLEIALSEVLYHARLLVAEQSTASIWALKMVAAFFGFLVW